MVKIRPIQSGVAVEGAERQSLEIRRHVARATYETEAATPWKASAMNIKDLSGRRDERPKRAPETSGCRSATVGPLETPGMSRTFA